VTNVTQAEYHYIDVFRVIRSAGRSDVAKARAVAQFVADEVYSAIEQARADDGWQPIATCTEPTALSSGNGVLVAEADGTVGEAYYRNFGDDSDGWWWINTSWGDYPEPSRPRPTHWRALPAPPDAGQVGAGAEG
jgi:hypothetical protein